MDVERLPMPLFRLDSESIRPVQAPPMPEPYSLYGEQNMSCDNVPTPKKKCTTKSLSDNSMEWETVEDYVIEEPPIEATSVHRTPSATTTHEGESLVNLDFHCSVELGVKHPVAALSPSSSRQISIEEYYTRQAVTSEPDTEMEQTVDDLMRDAGYSDVASD